MKTTVTVKNPIIVVGGDFDNHDPTPAFEAVGGMDRIPSLPTRADATLDVIFTNELDHQSVLASLVFKRERDYK